jgi:hypothetical protein
MANDSKRPSTLSRLKKILGGGEKTPEETLPVVFGGDGGRRKPPPPSNYINENCDMAIGRRLIEQSGHRGLGISVHANERVNDEPLSMEQSLEAQSSSTLMSNPLLDSQRFDGIDPNVNPAPALNTDARTEYDNLRRQQEMEKQLRLGLMPSNSKKFNPKPSGY